MNSDDEDDEEIESGNEEDRGFIEDESDSEEQRIQPEDQKKEKKREHPLVKLEAKLRDYLSVSPVLGFNSGKYDLNAAKEFLFPILTEHEQVKFAVKRNNNFMCAGL